MLWLGGGGGLASRDLMVDQSCLEPGWQSARCDSHFSFLWFLIWMLISWFKMSIMGSEGFSERALSRSLMSFLAWVGMEG